jgi:hypothetical protein
MTKELLHALLRLWTLPTCNENDCTRVKWLTTLAALRDTTAAKAALKLEIVGVNVWHTI